MFNIFKKKNKGSKSSDKKGGRKGPGGIPSPGSSDKSVKNPVLANPNPVIDTGSENQIPTVT